MDALEFEVHSGRPGGIGDMRMTLSSLMAHHEIPGCYVQQVGSGNETISELSSSLQVSRDGGLLACCQGLICQLCRPAFSTIAGASYSPGQKIDTAD